MTPEKIQENLKRIQYPGFSRDIVSFGLVRDIQINGDTIHISVELTTADPAIPEKIAADIKTTLGALDGCKELKVKMEINAPKQANNPRKTGEAPSLNPLSGVKSCIAIASGKDGVGK